MAQNGSFVQEGCPREVRFNLSVRIDALAGGLLDQELRDTVADTCDMLECCDLHNRLGPSVLQAQQRVGKNLCDSTRKHPGSYRIHATRKDSMFCGQFCRGLSTS